MMKSAAAVLMATSMTLAACSTTPAQEDTLRGAGTGAGIGAAAGAGLGAVIGGLGVIEGAAIGAAVGGLAGAVWADRDNDGYTDGYVVNGQYYPGRPPETTYQAPAPAYQAPVRRGERG